MLKDVRNMKLCGKNNLFKNLSILLKFSLIFSFINNNDYANHKEIKAYKSIVLQILNAALSQDCLVTSSNSNLSFIHFFFEEIKLE